MVTEKKAKALRIMETLYYEVEVRDKNGKLISKQRRKAHSYLLQYFGLLKGQMAQKFGVPNTGNSSVRDTSNQVRAYPYGDSGLNNGGLNLKADSGGGTYGPVVGTGDTANSITTYSMAAQVVHGNGAGQLSYGPTAVEDPTNPSGNDYIFRLIRVYTNNSGDSITIKEIGLIVQCHDSGQVARLFLTARDVVTPTAVPNGSTLTVRYMPKITVA